MSFVKNKLSFNVSFDVFEVLAKLLIWYVSHSSVSYIRLGVMFCAYKLSCVF